MAQNDKLQFEFSGKERRLSFTLLAVGLVLAAIGIFTNLDSPTHIWTSLLYNTFFFVGIALGATFFISASTQGYGGWYIVFRRVMEAMSMYLPIGGVLLIIVTYLGAPYIYHWWDPAVVAHDSILSQKAAYLNVPGFMIRLCVYVIGWSGLAFLLRRNSVQGDTEYTRKMYQNSKYIAAAFSILCR